MDPALIRELKSLLGSSNVLSRSEDLVMYEYDGSVEKAQPGPGRLSAHGARSLAHRQARGESFQVPIVGRGSGTGLSGGALARGGGIMIVFARMNRILELDLENARAVVQPGVVNLDITRAVEHAGLYFAPDPSSQKSCTIGGNVAENAGGPHTLAYGCHHQPCHRAGNGAPRWRNRAHRQQARRRSGLRSCAVSSSAAKVRWPWSPKSP